MKAPSPRKTAVALHVLAGHSPPQAAKLAGYSPSYSAKAADRLMKDPAVSKIISDGQESLRGKTMFGLEEAVKECNAAIFQATLNNNDNAAVKALELKCKLHGLLIERVETKSFVDIGLALVEARQRSQGTIVVHATSVSLPSPEPTHYAHSHDKDDLFSD